MYIYILYIYYMYIYILYIYIICICIYIYIYIYILYIYISFSQTHISGNFIAKKMFDITWIRSKTSALKALSMKNKTFP